MEWDEIFFFFFFVTAKLMCSTEIGIYKLFQQRKQILIQCIIKLAFTTSSHFEEKKKKNNCAITVSCHKITIMKSLHELYLMISILWNE